MPELTEQFLRAFGDAYREARGSFGGEDWVRVWTAELRGPGETWNWNHVMVSLNGMPSRPAPPLKMNVFQMTAEKMGLQWWPREPMGIDCVLVSNSRSSLGGSIPVPFRVVLEHENDARVFHEEIARLAYVRCPLKVGITYALSNLKGQVPPTGKWQQKVKEWAGDILGTLSAMTREDGTTEYIYLLGSEDPQYELRWTYLGFNAAQGPDAAEWKSLVA